MNIEDLKAIQKIASQAMSLLNKYAPQDKDDDESDSESEDDFEDDDLNYDDE